MHSIYGTALQDASPGIQEHVARYDNTPAHDVEARTSQVALLRKLPATTDNDRMLLDFLVARFDATHRVGHDACVQVYDKLGQLRKTAEERGFHVLAGEIGALASAQLGRHSECIIDSCEGDPAKVNNRPAPGATQPSLMSNPVLGGVAKAINLIAYIVTKAKSLTRSKR